MSDEISRRRAASGDPEVADESGSSAGVAPDSGGETDPGATSGPATAMAESADTATAVAAATGASRLDGSLPEPEAEPVPGPADRIDADPDADDADDADDEGEGDAEGETPGDADAAEPAGEGPEVARFPDELTEADLLRLCDILLAVLFATEAPLTAARLGHAAGATAAQARKGLQVLEQRIEDQRLPLVLQETAGQYRLLTAPPFHDHLLRLRAIKKNERLTPAALETLAVIAFRQPVIRAEIEAIRGVKVGPVLRLLLDKKLIRTGERKDVPGRPVQYETTKEFLDRFGIKSIADLPTVAELKRGMV